MIALGPAGKVTHPFFLDKLEVSTKDYLECVKARQCSAADKVTGLFDEEKADAPAKDADGGTADAASAPTAATPDYLSEWSSRCNAHGGQDNHPINCVDLREAQAFCTWKEKRLPSEAEWDLAARGVENRIFPWGASAPSECGDACYDKNGACLRRAAGGGVATCVAGGRPADKTPEGVFDMGGNVSEWTADGVVRGGNFADVADLLKSTTRHEVAPALAHAKLGFRCAADAAPRDPKP
jgi:serine/threonine-protein kinase